MPPQNVLMYDSTAAQNIPHDARAAAGYVDGRWPSYLEIKRRVKCPVLSLGTNQFSDCMVLDTESGNATPDEAALWIVRQRERGIERPAVYSAVSVGPAIWAALHPYYLGRDHVRWWSAHFTDQRHYCGRECGYPQSVAPGATQFHAGSATDVSLTTLHWVRAVVRDYEGRQR